jgi:hypothetical protein
MSDFNGFTQPIIGQPKPTENPMATVATFIEVSALV